MIDFWELKAGKLKNYPHFDAVISIKKAQDLALDPDRVSRHAFFPFIRYQSRWRKYAAKGSARKPKIRPIRYAARADAYIFSRYRSLLSSMYEKELLSCDIAGCVLAYRKIVSDNESKCNIHHARYAFISVRNLKKCYAIAPDISQFFESLDHAYIKSMWCRVLKTDRLPKDHYRAFKAITSYSVVDKEAVYERLGFYGVKSKDFYNNDIKGYLKNFNEIPKQLCSGK